MFFPLSILVLVILATPITIIFDGPIIHGLLAAVAAISVGLVALRIRPGEAGFLAAAIRPVAAGAVVPAIWMLIQVMPLSSLGVTHPIWKSAAAALGQPLTGSISIDPGATLISFARYLSGMGIAFVAAAVAVDRRRAEWVLLALTVTATLIALMALTNKFGVSTFLSSGDGGKVCVAAGVASLGVILAAAAALHTLEQSSVRRPDQANSPNWPALVACLASLATCFLAVATSSTSQGFFAVIFGIAALAIAVIVRRFNLGVWGITAIISIILLAAIAIAAIEPKNETVGLPVAFAGQISTPMIAVTQRILAETGWAGTGAGTFVAVLPIYRGIDELTSGQIAPTTAAAIWIEMGRLFFWIILVGVIALVFALLRGAFRRRRDSFYPAAGASCVVTISVLSFENSASLSTSVLIIIAAVIGLAVAQSKSRSI
jgi:hypothetical protein